MSDTPVEVTFPSPIQVEVVAPSEGPRGPAGALSAIRPPVVLEDFGRYENGFLPAGALSVTRQPWEVAGWAEGGADVSAKYPIVLQGRVRLDEAGYAMGRLAVPVPVQYELLQNPEPPTSVGFEFEFGEGDGNDAAVMAFVTTTEDLQEMNPQDGEWDGIRLAVTRTSWSVAIIDGGGLAINLGFGSFLNEAGDAVEPLPTNTPLRLEMTWEGGTQVLVDLPTGESILTAQEDDRIKDYWGHIVGFQLHRPSLDFEENAEPFITKLWGDRVGRGPISGDSVWLPIPVPDGVVDGVLFISQPGNIPVHWERASVEMIWGVVDGTSGDVRFNLGMQNQSLEDLDGQAVGVPPTVSSHTVTPNPPSGGTLYTQDDLGELDLTRGFVSMALTRDSGHGEDDYDGTDVSVFGILLTRIPPEV